MNKFYAQSLKLVALFCMMLIGVSSAKAQWELVKECKAAHSVHITKSGNMLLSDYLFDMNGGIYLSTDEGKTWSKTDIADRNYNRFMEAGDYIFASGIGSSLARSADEGKTWELVSFAEAFKNILSPDVLDYDAVYAMAYHNGKLFVGDFCGGGIIYSEDFGETWTLTPRENLLWEYVDEESGKAEKYIDNFYNMVSFKGKLYAFGMMKVYVYDDAANNWTVLRDDSNFMAVSTIFNDKMYCGRSVMNETDSDPYLECTADGEYWDAVSRPEGLLDNNIRSLYSDDKNIYAGMQSRGIYYTGNEGESWVNISEGLPPFSDQVLDQYLSPLKFASSKDYLYVVIYDVPFSDRNVSGLYRYAKKSLPTGLEKVAAEGQVKVVVDNAYLNVGDNASKVSVYDLSGKLCPVVVENGRANIQGLDAGCYLYEVVVGNEKVTGKFFKK